jgi:hypothetical protein
VPVLERIDLVCQTSDRLWRPSTASSPAIPRGLDSSSPYLRPTADDHDIDTPDETQQGVRSAMPPARAPAIPCLAQDPPHAGAMTGRGATRRESDSGPEAASVIGFVPVAKKSPAPVLLKMPLDPSATLESGKYSEMFLEFAQPLLDLDPSGPPQDLRAMRSILQIAMLCWNLPVMERCSGGTAALGARHEFESAFQHLPTLVRRAIRDRLQARTTQFGAVPIYLAVRLEGTDLTNARLVAEARMPAPAPRPSSR